MDLQLNLQNYLRKEWLLVLLTIFSFQKNFSQTNGVAINTTGIAADKSAILDLTNIVNKGFLLPQVLNTSDVSNPANGLVIYQTGGPAGIYFNAGTSASPNWVLLGAASGNGNYIQNQAASSQTANYYISGPASIGIANSSTASLNVAASNAANNAIVGTNTAASNTNIGDGIDGFTKQSKGAGVYGYNTNTNGTGIIGAGNNVTGGGYYLVNGSGGAFTGEITGLYAQYTSGNPGTAAIVTDDNTGLFPVFVNYWDGLIQYKIIGAGTVSTTALNIDSKSRVTFHAPEAPEILFEDYGEGKLVNGKTHITLDPVFSKNVIINEKHPLRVFIQLEGDCNGVYVTNKSKNGFDVIELNQGLSNTAFQWHIVCNRADEDLGNGKISRNADARFEPAPVTRDKIQFKPAINK